MTSHLQWVLFKIVRGLKWCVMPKPHMSVTIQKKKKKKKMFSVKIYWFHFMLAVWRIKWQESYIHWKSLPSYLVCVLTQGSASTILLPMFIHNIFVHQLFFNHLIKQWDQKWSTAALEGDAISVPVLGKDLRTVLRGALCHKLLSSILLLLTPAADDNK